MTPGEYLDRAKEKMGLKSDYALAKRFEVSNGHMPEYRSGKRALSPYLCAKLAITLELDPAEVIADIEAQREKNPKRAEFWRSFRSHARCLVLAACMLASIFSGGLGAVAGGIGGARRPRIAV